MFVAILRASSRVSRCCKVQQARELLAPVYGWFTEGFDTHDLQGAYLAIAMTSVAPNISL